MYVKGVCKSNPGTGGWGVYWKDGSSEGELSGGADQSTNNIMELTAAINGLSSFNEPRQITVYLESEYVRDGATKYLEKWKANGWKGAQKKKIKNLELWLDIDKLSEFHDIEWKAPQTGSGGMLKAITRANDNFENV